MESAASAARQRQRGSARLVPAQGNPAEPGKAEYDGIAGLEVRASRHRKLLGSPVPPLTFTCSGNRGP
jgi:hypothetical protein